MQSSASSQQDESMYPIYAHVLTISFASREAKDRSSCYYYLDEQVEKRPDALFLIYHGQQWTYKEAQAEIHKRASWLQQFNIKKNEIVALDFTNKPSFIWLWFGLWAIGACPAFINYNLTEASLLHCIKISTSRLLIFDDEVTNNVATIKDQLKTENIRVICHQEESQGPDWCEKVTPAEFATQSTARPDDSFRSGFKQVDPSVLIYTSGSTGLPKAAIVPWSKWSMGVYTSSALIGLRPDDRFYSCMPLYHATAACLGMGSSLIIGCTFVLGHKFSHATFWPDVRQSDATVIQYVGEVCRFLVGAQPSAGDKDHKVRMAYGNGMRPDVWERFRSRFGIQEICEFYTSTEGVSGSFNTNSNSFGAGAIGRAGPIARAIANNAAIIKVDMDTEELVRDANGICVECPRCEPGELLYLVEPNNAERAFVGYFGNNKATNSKLIRDVKKKGDTYMRMGDLISIDHDGFQYFHDRLGDTFRWKGENVSTTQVSEAIGSFPGIAEANVYGVQVPGHDGRAGAAAIDLDPKAPLDYDKLAAHVTKTLPKYAVPQFLRIAKNMQSTGNYKQQKVGLRNDGVLLAKMAGDKLLWLKKNKYVEFTEADYAALVAGKARL